MVYIIDVCKEWVHEVCSTGMANLIEEAFPQEKVVLYAEKEHIHAMKNVGLTKRIRTREVRYPKRNTWMITSVPYYTKLSRILKNLKPGDFVFSLASEKSLIEATYRIANKQTGVNFYLVVHGSMEEILAPDSGIGGIKWKELLAKKTMDKKIAYLDDHIFPLGETIKRSEDYQNIKFITYGPGTFKEFNKVFNKRVLDKFLFMHHPLMPENRSGCRRTDGKIRIGVWGNCVNNKFSKVIAYVNKKVDTDNYEFIILRAKKNSATTIPKLKNTKVYEPDDDGFTRAQMTEFFCGMDFALISYAKDKYRVSCSGILADAISNRIPIMALDCAPCRYYQEKYNIGYVEKTIGALGESIIKAINEKVTFSAMDTLAERLNKENVDILRAEVDEG